MNIKSTSFLFVLLLSMSMPLNLYSQDENSSETGLKDAMNLSNVGKFSEAIEKLQLLIKQQPDAQGLLAHEHLGFVYFKAKQYDNALNEFEQITRTNADSTISYYYLGLIYEARAIKNTDPGSSKEEKRKALRSWEEFLRCSALPQDTTEAHKNRIMAPADRRKFAQRHIHMLEEELGNE